MKIRQVLPAMVAATWLLAGAARAEVTVLGWPGGPEETALRAVAKVYNGKSGTADADKVDLIFFNRDGFWDKLQTDLAAGGGDFDLNLLATYAIGRYAPFMEPVDLPASAQDIFGQKVLGTMQFDGKQYGVPTDLSLHFMYFRQDLIDKLLSDPDWQKRYGEISKDKLGKAMQPVAPDQWTWDDYEATALFFTKSVNPDSPTRYGTVLQMKNLLFNIMVWQSTARSYGGDWMDDGGKVTVDSPAYRKGLELYKKLYDWGASPKDSLTYEYPEANAAFGSGQVATMLQWNAALPDLNDAEKTPAVAGKIGTVPPPEGDVGRFTHIHGLGLGLNKAAKNKDGALKFLHWLAGAEAMQAYAVAGGAPALTPDALAPIKEQRPDLAKLGDYAGRYGFVMTGATSAGALAVYELQAEQFTGYWAGQKSLDEALSATAAKMADLLKK